MKKLIIVAIFFIVYLLFVNLAMPKYSLLIRHRNGDTSKYYDYVAPKKIVDKMKHHGVGFAECDGDEGIKFKRDGKWIRIQLGGCKDE